MVTYIAKTSPKCKACKTRHGERDEPWDAPWRSEVGLCLDCHVKANKRDIFTAIYGRPLGEAAVQELNQRLQIRHQSDAHAKKAQTPKEAAAIALSEYRRAWKAIWSEPAVKPLENEPDDGLDLPDRKPCIRCGTRKGQPNPSGKSRARDRGRCKRCASSFYEEMGRKGVVA